jgi:hypothetical protein
MSAAEVATRAWGWPRLIVASLVGGVAFNITQRVLDFGLDHLFALAPWLAWLNN